MSLRKPNLARHALFAVALMAAPSLAMAQTVCEPGKFTPQDHEYIIRAIVRDAPEVIGKIRYNEVTRANNGRQVLLAALAAEGIPENVKNCIRALPPESLSPDAIARIEQRYPAVRQLLDGVTRAASLPGLQAYLRQSAQDAAQPDVKTVLQTARQIVDQGRSFIYNSEFYINAARRYGSSAPEAIGSGMALELAKADVRDAIIGGLLGAFLGPEAIGPHACEEAIRSSAEEVVRIFVDLWFG